MFTLIMLITGLQAGPTAFPAGVFDNLGACRASGLVTQSETLRQMKRQPQMPSTLRVAFQCLTPEQEEARASQ